MYCTQGGKAGAAADAHARAETDEDGEAFWEAEPNDLSAEELVALFATFSTGPLPLSGPSAPAVSAVDCSVPSRALVDKATKVGSLPAVKELHEERDGTRHAGSESQTTMSSKNQQGA